MIQVHRIDETGKRYGRLVVVEVLKRSLASRFKRAKAKWLCVCDCGTRTAVFGDKLRSGQIRMCLSCERAIRGKPMETLIKRLRKEQQWGNALDGEAADAIEKLQRELGEERYSREIASAKAWHFSDRIKRLEAALRGVIAIADRDCPEFRDARAALEGEQND